MADRCFVCRCEDVTLTEIEHTITRGLGTVEEIKRYTGLGTGPCQGKECVSVLCKVLIARGVLRPEDAQPFTARPPVEPVTFASLAAAELQAGPEDEPT